MSVPVPIKGS